ncbi:transglutaminase family protein [Pseudactinotalea sp.]|uniref:transglutaminase family protein n=1 Tax=Pseudactinotalea sp. TaxID=1926260 RepID=UPI003B3AAAF1
MSAASRLHIVHRTTFTYARSVTASYNEARMRPAELPHQHLISSRITATPSTHHSSYVDYWGTTVTPFEVLTAHEALVVLAESRVDVTTPPPVEEVGWDVLRSAEVADRMCEYLAATSVTEPAGDLVELATDAIGDRSPSDAARTILGAMREEMEYVPGVTGVHTKAMESWDARSGVCQDIAHLGVGALRAVGIPTRYVSGYLHPLTSQAEPGVPVTGESHAWVEYWVGDWVGFDPTNRTEVGDHHVIVARGREYGDVTPLRGVYAGGGKSSQQVEVRITREA